MIEQAIILTDYKGFFGSKQKSYLYRGGMDISKIIDLFIQSGIHAISIPIRTITNSSFNRRNSIFLYTSAEDRFDLYKSYIDDIVFHLEEQEYYIIPNYSCLKAHNNKVALELLRKRSKLDLINTLHSNTFGTLEELKCQLNQISYPIVIKTFAGSMSRGVFLANNKKELYQYAKRVTKSYNIFHDVKDNLRKLKYGRRYQKESTHRKKFIVQDYIPGLRNDWKVLVYGNKCFVLYRRNRNNDFRASGSGNFEFRRNLPTGLLDYALTIRKAFRVPNISLDIGFDGEQFYLFEFQFLFFGTTTLEKANFYYQKVGNDWETINTVTELEKVYVDSIIYYLNEEGLIYM